MSKLKREEVMSLLEMKVESKINAIPKVEVPKFEPKMGKGDEEVMGLMLSDIHFGHKTPTTTCRIISNRLGKLGEAVVKIADIHRNTFPIKKLVIFLMGDMIQSDRIGRFVSLNELEGTVMTQMFDWAIPELCNFLLGLQEHFEEIEIFTVPGNHGKVRKNAGTDTNWDNIIYKAVRGRLNSQPRFKWNIEQEQFYQIAKVMKWGFLMMHGDNIRSYLNIPWYGEIRMMNRMRGAVPGRFHYALYGHFHTSAIYKWNDIEIMNNGCFVTDDQWVLKKMGMSSDCSQMVFGIHPRKGVSYRYKLGLNGR